MKNTYKVIVKIGDATVDVQGAESGVVKIVKALSELLATPRRTATPASPAPSPTLPTASTARVAAPTDIRSFFQEKMPSSDVEAAAVAAYYNQYMAAPTHRRDTLDADSLQEAFRLARWPLPKRTIFTLVNARNAGYLDSAGDGQYRLNPVGYNLVEHTIGRPDLPKSKPSRKKKR